jgi:hypothetical protein
MSDHKQQEPGPDGVSTGPKRADQATRFSKDRQPNRAKVYGDASLLEDMRHVRAHPKSQDTTEGQRGVRRWMNTDPKSFYTRMAALEEAEVAAAAKKAPQQEPETYAGLERAIQTCEQWLKSWAE